MKNNEPLFKLWDKRKHSDPDKLTRFVARLTGILFAVCVVAQLAIRWLNQ